MDFIEKLFGFSPDGGSGVFELMLFLVPLVGICWLALTRAKRARERNRRGTGAADDPRSGSRRERDR